MRDGDEIRVGGRPYRIGALLGRGRTSSVYPLETGDGSESGLVVKVRDPSLRAGPGIDPAEFIVEVDRIQALRAHAGQSLDCFTRIHAVDPDGAWFVMDRAQGRPLSRMIRDRNILQQGQILSIAVRLTEVLIVARDVGIRNVDLKLDAIFYEPKQDRLVVLDWNVCAPWRPDEEGWIDPDARLVAAVLDGLLRNAMTSEGGDSLPDWRRRFDRPRRFASYPHVVQSALGGLLAERDTQVGLDEVHAVFTHLSSILALPDEQLLERVLEQLHEHRARPAAGADAIREALGLAQLVARSRIRRVALDGRAALLASSGLLSDDGPAIATLWACLDDPAQDAEVEPGSAPELKRLRRLVAVRRRAIGFGDRLRQVAVHVAYLRWREAAAVLEDVLRTVEHPEIARQLRPLADEATGLMLISRALGRLDELDPASGSETDLSVAGLAAQRSVQLKALDEFELGISHLAEVPWADVLFNRLPGILEQRDALLAKLERHAALSPDDLGSGASSAPGNDADPRVRSGDGVGAVAPVPDPRAHGVGVPTSRRDTHVDLAVPGSNGWTERRTQVDFDVRKLHGQGHGGGVSPRDADALTELLADAADDFFTDGAETEVYRLGRPSVVGPRGRDGHPSEAPGDGAAPLGDGASDEPRGGGVSIAPPASAPIERDSSDVFAPVSDEFDDDRIDDESVASGGWGPWLFVALVAVIALVTAAIYWPAPPGDPVALDMAVLVVGGSDLELDASPASAVLDQAAAPDEPVDAQSIDASRPDAQVLDAASKPHRPKRLRIGRRRVRPPPRRDARPPPPARDAGAPPRDMRVPPPPPPPPVIRVTPIPPPDAGTRGPVHQDPVQLPDSVIDKLKVRGELP